MKPSSLFAGIAAALLLTAGQPFAAEDKAAGAAKANAAKPADAVKPAEKAKAPAAAKLVDINSASKQDLAKLPGVSETDADKIIAGRPYGSKAHLQTRNILSADTYQGLNKLVIARQPTKDAGKNAELQKKK